MDNTPWNTWDIGKLTDFPIQNLDSLFKNKGIEVSAEEQSNIEEAIRKNPDLIKYIEQDILAIQGNPTEKSRFETLYIKGFWQVVVIDWKTMSFSEISWLPKKEKEAIINGMTRIDKIWFREWELEAANQRIEWKKEIEQAANQKWILLKAAIQESRLLGKTLDMVFADQGIVNLTPEIIERNKARGNIILSALNNPLVWGKMPAASKNALKILWESLVNGQNPAYASHKMAEGMIADLKNIQ